MENKLKIKYLRKLLLFSMGGILFISCGTAKRSEPVKAKLDIKSEGIASGQMVFMKNCHKCHPGGQAGVGPSLNNIHLPGFLIRIRVRDKAFLLGLGRMPSFKINEISRLEMDDLILYLEALKKNKKPGNNY
jgi:mono/diheme cytochrome c family protein